MPSIITAPSGLVQHKHYGTLIPPMRPRRVDSADHFGVKLSVSFRDFSYFHGDEGGGTNVARKDSFDFAAGPYRRNNSPASSRSMVGDSLTLRGKAAPPPPALW